MDLVEETEPREGCCSNLEVHGIDPCSTSPLLELNQYLLSGKVVPLQGNEVFYS